MQKTSMGITLVLTPKVSFDSHVSSHQENKLDSKGKITFLQWFTEVSTYSLPDSSQALCTFVSFFLFEIIVSSSFPTSWEADSYVNTSYIHSYKNTPGTHKWLTFPEPETVAPCPWTSCKSLVLFGLKVMSSQRAILLTVTSQFPRLRHGSMFYVLSLCQW